MGVANFFVFLFIALSCFRLLRVSASKLPQEEVDALREITSAMGSAYWKFDADSCSIEMVGLTQEPPAEAERSIGCNCSFEDNTVCHVVTMTLKRLSLPGTLPPQLAKLPFLREVDFAYNCFTGSIPEEWASMKLTSISLLVNRLSGEIPKHLGNFTALTYLMLEANQFSGAVPPELGKLINLQTLVLSSNQLTGNLPLTLAGLQNLTDFRINDNNFTGTIPSFIQSWQLLQRLEMHASGLEGPLPSNISLLKNLVMLRISDIESPAQVFPHLENMANLAILILRSCNLSGVIPSYVWTMRNLAILDVSFNMLVGGISSIISARRLRFIYLTGNMLSGNIPNSVLKDGSSIDLSYNNFTWQDYEQPACQDGMNLNLNLFRSSILKNKLEEYVPCSKNFSCSRFSSCLHVNCGGKDVRVRDDRGENLYAGDENVQGGTATYFYSDDDHWGFSSTGDFMDDFEAQNVRYTVSLPSSNMPELYKTARVSPITLTYFHNCMQNGNYTVNLHFAEIQFTNDKTYKSLGKRIFDIYVQGRITHKNFNIENETNVAEKPLVLPIHNISITNNVLEIRFYWAGKGTTRIPDVGVYGPLVSAISVISDSRVCSTGKKKVAVSIIIAIVAGAVCLVLFISGLIWWKWKSFVRGKRRQKEDAKDGDMQSGNFSLENIRAATNDFSSANKIGEGGFGPVYKGQLVDGTFIAVKQLSSKSRQGNREFINEIGLISCVQHPNLVKLHGYCAEGEQLLLVYEYMENNSLARALFGSENQQLKLDWPTRFRICIGIAKGLAFLHDESRFKIVHRDIKASNVLLDADLNPKISDFGLARLDETEKTHISTRVAGTIGYMAPEYALWGYLTYKADVYSFGVVVLEIVSGKSNNNYLPDDGSACLLDWACKLNQAKKLEGLVDERLEQELNETEVEKVVRIALLCTNASVSLRPTMSEVVKMFEGELDIPDAIPEPSTYSEDLRFKALRDLNQHRSKQSLSGNSSTHIFSSASGGNTHTSSNIEDHCSVDNS
ncbi:probable LRR receptor-like serine/threonine-protein kinase RFK1 isoform X2 [Vigna unguiculata]|uniref:probable LRR receptor-like serine/threonine-protein kinase RFK1 isoform X2 n=1 Tax=Vigna unguiculata TaxID=3917 RepID=UPI0010163B25|nr:probable LRR receptor-like serine/threonine-protein kinase RFK1 isoform X2 [Vigna unguiculata]